MTRLRARIKKGVRPYGGRAFDVVEIREGYVTLNLRKSGQMLNYSMSDPRQYRADEVEILGDRPLTRKEIGERNARWVEKAKVLLTQRDEMKRLDLDEACYIALKLVEQGEENISLLHVDWIIAELKKAE